MTTRCPDCGAPTDSLGRHLPPPQPDGFTQPSISTDACCIRTTSRGPEVLLIVRGHWPGQGLLAFPGGFCDYGEDPERSVLRELAEETGIEGRSPRLLLAHGAPDRDPRKHVITLLYHVEVDALSAPEGGDDAASADWYPLNQVLPEPDRFAFDHHDMLVEALLALGIGV